MLDITEKKCKIRLYHIHLKSRQSVKSSNKQNVNAKRLSGIFYSVEKCDFFNEVSVFLLPYL